MRGKQGDLAGSSSQQHIAVLPGNLSQRTKKAMIKIRKHTKPYLLLPDMLCS